MAKFAAFHHVDSRVVQCKKERILLIRVIILSVHLGIPRLKTLSRPSSTPRNLSMSCLILYCLISKCFSRSFMGKRKCFRRMEQSGYIPSLSMYNSQFHLIPLPTYPSGSVMLRFFVMMSKNNGLFSAMVIVGQPLKRYDRCPRTEKVAVAFVERGSLDLLPLNAVPYREGKQGWRVAQ